MLGRTHRRAVLGEVLGRQEPALLFHEGDDLAGDVAAVESIACRFEPGLAASPIGAMVGGCPLFVGHVLQRRCKVGLAEHLASFGEPPIRQKDRRGRGPGAVIRLVALQALGHQRIHRKAVARQSDRRRGDLAKAHRAVAPECGDPGVGGGWNDSPQHALGDPAAMLALEEFGVERLWPRTEPGDGHHLVLVGELDTDRCHAGDVYEVALQHPERDPGAAPRIDRVAASLQDTEAGGRREIMPRGDRVPGDGDGRPMRRCSSHGDPSARCSPDPTVALDRLRVEGALWRGMKVSGMSEFDLVIRNGAVATASDTTSCDVGIKDGVITTLGKSLAVGAQEIDASGRLVLPGGIDSHCHIEQRSSAGVVCADDFYSATVAAAFGGTTTVIPFAAQHRGQSLRRVVEEYHEAARPKAIIDYAFHLIITDPSEQVMGQELPALIRDGYPSFKAYMTYDLLGVADGQMLDVLAVARREGAFVMVHAENHEMIKWLTSRLLERGLGAPRYHAVSHARLAEGEATNRAVALSQLLDVPILLVHVSAGEAIEVIRNAQTKGLKIYGETCPQYLFLTADDLARPGVEGAKFCCSPPPRDEAAQQAVWTGLRNGTFQVFSSDHAPYRFDASGKLPHGDRTIFKEIANGVPGIELRLPLLFSEGVGEGRLDLNAFVALTATNHAKLYGLYPRKGTIAVGSDADIAIWDPDPEPTVTAPMLHDNVGYTPYEGRRLRGWPVTVISRGRIVVDDGTLLAARGSGNFLPCALSDAAKPRGAAVPELAYAAEEGTALV